MATQTLEFNATPGLTITLKLFALDSDVVVDTAAATEKTNDKGRYTAAFTDVAAATYRANGFVSTDGGFVNELYVLTLSTATFYPESEAMLTLRGADGDTLETLSDQMDLIAGEGIYTLTVTVQDGDSAVVSGARVTISGTTYYLTSDSSGQCVFNVDSGSYTLVTSPPSGYDTPDNVAKTVSANDTATITLTASSPSGTSPGWLG